MIPISVCIQPNVFMVSILLYLLQLFFISLSSSLSLQITQTTISFPHHIDHKPNSILSPMPTNQQKKLRRLPHVFSKVLELPLRSHDDVFIEDKSDCIRFIAKIDYNAFVGQVKAYAVKIHPGVTKVVVRGGNNILGEVELLLEKLEIDDWRFRLPATTRPELATAVVVGTELVVTVPKGSSSVGGREVWERGKGRLVSVR